MSRTDEASLGKEIKRMASIRSSLGKPKTPVAARKREARRMLDELEERSRRGRSHSSGLWTNLLPPSEKTGKVDG